MSRAEGAGFRAQGLRGFGFRVLRLGRAQNRTPLASEAMSESPQPGLLELKLQGSLK